MKADLPLNERQRIAAEDQRELRAALIHRQFDTMEGWQLVAGGALAHNLRVADIVDAKLRAKRAGEPLPCAMPMRTEHVVAAGSDDQPDLRARLGLS